MVAHNDATRFILQIGDVMLVDYLVTKSNFTNESANDKGKPAKPLRDSALDDIAFFVGVKLPV